MAETDDYEERVHRERIVAWSCNLEHRVRPRADRRATSASQVRLARPAGRGIVALVLPHQRSASARLDRLRVLGAASDSFAAEAESLVNDVLKTVWECGDFLTFGSRAYRVHHPESDPDLVPIMDRDKRPGLIAPGSTRRRGW